MPRPYIFRRPDGQRAPQGRKKLIPDDKKIELGRRIFQRAFELSRERTAQRYPRHSDRIRACASVNEFRQYLRVNKLTRAQRRYVEEAQGEIWNEFLVEDPLTAIRTAHSATVTWANAYREAEKAEFREKFCFTAPKDNQ